MAKDVKEMLKDYKTKKYITSYQIQMQQRAAIAHSGEQHKKTTPHQHAILKENNTWSKTSLEKASVFARNFKNTFTNINDTKNITCLLHLKQ